MTTMPESTGIQLGDGDGNDLLGTGTLIDVDRDYGARAGFIEEPDPAITDNDLAQDTEQVKVGSLAVGDTVWLDQNRNGVVDAGESGIPNVLVFIDFTATAQELERAVRHNRRKWVL